MNETAQALGIGTLIGIVLFFVLAGFGVIDKLIASVENWFQPK